MIIDNLTIAGFVTAIVSAVLLILSMRGDNAKKSR